MQGGVLQTAAGGRETRHPRCHGTGTRGCFTSPTENYFNS